MLPMALQERTVRTPEGRFVEINGRSLYEIENIDAMPPFLMTVVGDTDLWMFLSSNGSFTAGRVEAERCLFPYETDDRLHELTGIAGPITLVRFDDGRVWEPMCARADASSFSRTLRRSAVGDVVQFEETDTETGLIFRAEFALSDTYGIVRRCELLAPDTGAPVEVELLDGYVHIMPAGVPLGLQQTMSTLVDGYKRSELVGDAGPAVYLLESPISDKPEASESLRVNTMWHTGLNDAAVSLDGQSVEAFRAGRTPSAGRLSLGRRGAYLCHASVRIAPGTSERWSIVGDTDLDHGQVARLARELESKNALADRVEASLERDHESLAALLDRVDGAQTTADAVACAAHRSNVLFNAMRGGVPLDGYAVDASDFRRFVGGRNREIAHRHAAFLGGLPEKLGVETLPNAVSGAGCPQLTRLAMEYLPLTFGRRHGDPSRPWNQFRIKVRDAAGERVSGYEGNWRDIFQNWEAMCRSYPALLPGVIAKFVNASTVDGHNPYRINEHGIDWEAPEPDNVRSNIGYWGDHQIVYLLRLLEQCHNTLPDALPAMLDQRVFSYANVPYRIRPFAEIAADPRASIRFDHAEDAKIRGLDETIGSDARLVLNDVGEPALVTLVEKLLVPALAKVSNLVPGGGVWMNMQRPEWNDANNALAGFGLSMVTLYQLRRYCDFATDLIASGGTGTVMLSPAVAKWCEDVTGCVERVLADAKDAPLTSDRRWNAMRELGSAFETACAALYRDGPAEPIEVERAHVLALFRGARDLCDDSIRQAKRADGLYESYNVLRLDGERASVDHLNMMLEGQVAVLSSGVLDAGEASALLDTLFGSSLYRQDARSFILYPRIDLPPFMERNVVPRDAVAGCELLERALTQRAAGLLEQDADGTIRFCAGLNSHDALSARLDVLAADAEWSPLVAAGRDGAHAAFERTFNHAKFTGRSGTMHKYEGIGSIYWHMVSKLLIATQECVFQAKDAGVDAGEIAALRAHYWAVRDGLGFRKTPAEYGAVPHEPYSHTPWSAGAQQPGMTGQVKEGVLARFGELGVRVVGGQITFDAVLIDPAEVLATGSTLQFLAGAKREVAVPRDAIGLTLCGTPIVVHLAGTDQVRVHHANGTCTEIAGNRVPTDLTRAVFARDGSIDRIEAQVSRAT